MINKLLLGKPVETLCHASCYFVQSYSPLAVFTLTNPTALSLLGQISVILAKGESECCMLLFDIKTTFRDKTMSDKNDIFGGD